MRVESWRRINYNTDWTSTTHAQLSIRLFKNPVVLVHSSGMLSYLTNKLLLFIFLESQLRQTNDCLGERILSQVFSQLAKSKHSKDQQEDEREHRN